MLLFTSGQLGGAEKSLTRMATIKSETTYYLATLGEHGPWTSWTEAMGFNPIVYGHLNFFSFLKRFKEDIDHLSIDIVYVCGLKASVAIRLLMRTNPTVKVVHGIRWNPASSSLLDMSLLLIERTLGFLVDRYIVNSLAGKKTLVSRCSIAEKKVSVIYNGLGEFRSNQRKPSDRDPIVLIVANFHERKGHIPFLAVVRIISLQHPQAKFVFVGDGVDGQVFKTEIVKQGLQQAVLCEGFQQEPEYWYQRARIFALPSLWNEGCPTSILEAMSYSLPCVAFGIDGIPELVDHNRDGLIIKKGNYSEMAAGISRLLCDDYKVNAMGDSAAKKVEREFTVKRTAELHSAAFKEVLSSQ